MSMKPVLKAAEVYHREACRRTFREDLEAHLLHGFVYSTSDRFVMARPVVVNAPDADIVDPWHNSWDGEPDCWHLYLFSGNMISAFQSAPYKLPWVSFERNNILRRYEWDVMWEKCARFFPPSLRH